MKFLVFCVIFPDFSNLLKIPCLFPTGKCLPFSQVFQSEWEPWLKYKRNATPVFNTQYLCVEVGYVLVTLLVYYRVDYKKPVSFSHVLFSHSTELFLTSRVQYWNE